MFKDGRMLLVTIILFASTRRFIPCLDWPGLCSPGLGWPGRPQHPRGPLGHQTTHWYHLYIFCAISLLWSLTSSWVLATVGVGAGGGGGGARSRCSWAKTVTPAYGWVLTSRSARQVKITNSDRFSSLACHGASLTVAPCNYARLPVRSGARDSHPHNAIKMRTPTPSLHLTLPCPTSRRTPLSPTQPNTLISFIQWYMQFKNPWLLIKFRFHVSHRYIDGNSIFILRRPKSRE